VNDPILDVKNLSVDYITEKSSVKAVRSVSFKVQKGQIFGLVGESGSGKSTVVQSILRTLPPPALITGGSVMLENEDILSASISDIKNYRWKKISIVMQSALNALNPVLTIKSQISDVFEFHTDYNQKEIENRIENLLDLINIDKSWLSSYPHQLSGGMKQRVVLAIALALMPPLIIMDEPTTALDVIIEREILLNILELKNRMEFSILFITHDLNLLLEFADEIAIMKNGHILDLDSAEKIQEGGKHKYTKKLINSIPSATGNRKEGVLSYPEKPNFSANPLLELKNVTKHFPVSGFLNQRAITAVRDVSFKIHSGQILALVGESGSGKSTIAKLINRLIRPTFGDILLNGENTSVLRDRHVSLDYRKQIQMVFQDPFGSLNPIHTVYHHLERPLLRHHIISKKKIHNRIIEMLETVELIPGDEFAKKFPHEMSGGERQRVAIARALSLNPKLIVADEPTSMLDVSIRMDILEIFAQMRIKKNLAIIFITHDLASARYLADQIIVLQKGSIIEQGDSEKIVQEPTEIYTQELVKAASPGWVKNLSGEKSL
tara:strand:+ start:71192 stop:72844 length:1653 start_codon:yes stop_codon:yes gene_type:complete